MPNTYCISDVHGCFRELNELLEKISPATDDTVFILGDIADRGDMSAETIVWAVDTAPDNVRFLLGNHDLMMRTIVHRDPAEMPMRMSDTWSYNGGYETSEALWEQTTPEWRAEKLLPWLEKLVPFAYVETDAGPFMLVHAGFDPNVWGDKPRAIDTWHEGPDFEVGHGFGTQNELVMCWVRDGWTTVPSTPPIDVVFGHTPTRYLARLAEEEAIWVKMGNKTPWPDFIKTPPEPDRIWFSDHRADIDCGCAYGGNLAALRLEDKETFYVASKQPTYN